MPRPPSRYQVLTASDAVRRSLVQAGMAVDQAAVVYPGARVELFGDAALRRPLPPRPDGSPRRPLRVCFAGLQMASKGPHTLLEALLLLRQRGIPVEMTLAGGCFQKDYAEQLRQFCQTHALEPQVRFLPQLTRAQLARCFRLHHAFVFPSLFPEAFGIVAAEAMASGLALVSTGVGGAAEVFEDGISGLSYPAGDAAALADRLAQLAQNPALLERIQTAGELRVREQFSVTTSVRQLEELLRLN